MTDPVEPAPGDLHSAPSPSPPGPPPPARETPRQRFEEEIARRQESLDDHEPEESLWQGSYSPKAMVGTWLLMIVASIALLIVPSFVEGLTYTIVLILIALGWIVIGGAYAARRLGYHYELTSQRFIHKSGLLTRRTDRIEVIDIDDVSYQQGPIQRLFGVGTINITSSDRSDPELDLHGINKVSEVAGLIDDVRRTERRRRSLHIESI